jgi:hypothetical protein
VYDVVNVEVDVKVFVTVGAVSVTKTVGAARVVVMVCVVETVAIV